MPIDFGDLTRRLLAALGSAFHLDVSFAGRLPLRQTGNSRTTMETTSGATYAPFFMGLTAFTDNFIFFLPRRISKTRFWPLLPTLYS